MTWPVFKRFSFATSLCLSVLVSLTACGGGGNDSGGTVSVPPPAIDIPTTIPVPVLPTQRGASAAAWQTARGMGPGVNFGDMLEAPNEGDWGLRVEPAYIDAAWQAGFRTVRLPVRWSNHSQAFPPYTVDTVFLSRVLTVVDQLLAKGFYVVMGMQHHRQLDGDALDAGEFAVDPTVLEPRFVAMWEQIGRHFAPKSNKLVFELYNEPHGRLTANGWNDLLATTLARVRLSNPARLVALGATSFSNANALNTLRLPNDPNLLVTFHHYEPFNFTHQGATWVTPLLPVGVTCCNEDQLADVNGAIAKASAWSVANGYPIFLGEFGANAMADMASRANYTRAVRNAANAQQIPWIYWEFAGKFGVYNPINRQFFTELTSALMAP